ncbi:MAG: cell division protein ZapA [Firmicutes bacterium]|nr:cell division protein ZapA [Bacillota bacterium]
MAARNKVDVEIFGEHYKIKGEAAPEYMTRLARYVDQTMRKVVQRNPRLTLHKAAVLSAINIADELLKVLDQQEAENKTETNTMPKGDATPAEEIKTEQPAKDTGKKKGKKKKNQG